MKIGIEAQRLLRTERHGMDVVAVEMINNLQILDKKNEYIIFAKNDLNFNGINFNNNFKLQTIKASNYLTWEQLILPKAIKKEKLDLIHCTANTAPLKLKIPLILTLHDIIFMEQLNFKGTAYQNFGNIYRRILLKKIIHHCDTIITVSNYENQRICEYFQLDASKVKTIYNGISPNFRCFSELEKDNARIKFSLPKEFILFFANPAPKKNTINVLKAYSVYHKNASHPLPLVLIDTNGDYINQAVRNLKIEFILKNIIVIKYIPYEEIPALYNLATIFLYPSLRESFGLPLIEAMACGTPVISSNTSSMPEIGGDGALFIDPYDPIQIANAMNDLLSNNLLKSKYIDLGLQQAKKFSWKNMAQEMLSVYEAYC